jgi:hydroxyethylthiazole kinase-like uncharacterized protein yjeF
LVREANSSGSPIVAIDIPTGLDSSSGWVEKDAIRATDTVFLGLPKLGFFLKQGWDHVGRLHHVEFGLDAGLVQQVEGKAILLEKSDFIGALPSVKRSRHKYQAGYVVGVAGSKAMPGAAVLAGGAALRSGAGIVRLFHPIDTTLPSYPLELIREGYEIGETERVWSEIERASALFVGPGMGSGVATGKWIRELCSGIQKGCVLDADALNLIAQERQVTYPPKTVITPHFGEMARLLGDSEGSCVSSEWLRKCQEYAERYGIVIVLKGGPTFILAPGHAPKVCPFGSPGMATAGSGDVLTGVIAALLAQGLDCSEAATLGTVLHGIAGEKAAQNKTVYGMIASDIVEAIPEVIQDLS